MPRIHGLDCADTGTAAAPGRAAACEHRPPPATRTSTRKMQPPPRPSPTAPIHTRASLRADLERLGVARGDIVMVHAAMRRVGRLLHGPDALVAALADAVGDAGTIVAYTDWDGAYEDLLDADGRIPAAWRDQVPGFDAQRSRAIRDNGVLAECIRSTPGARRSANPGASVAALGARAHWLTDAHPLDDGYGPGTPLARLVEAGGKVLMVGAPLDTMTLLHHAEHLAAIPGKRRKRVEVPLATRAGTTWRWIEEFDTAAPVVAGLADDYFAQVVREFLAGGHGTQGPVGEAASVLVDAPQVCAFAVAWLERHVPGLPGASHDQASAC